jgi:phosphoribosylformylglycinamidine (FGAM) synthase-like amidotransferase family enzyme
VFTEFMDDEGPMPVPLAHAEGRFATSDPGVRARLEAGDGVAFVYTDATGARAGAFPDNPNGSAYAIAALCNPAGNAMAIMPHPERAAWLHQVPRRVGGRWGRLRDEADASSLFAAGPGRAIFTSLKRGLA